MEKRNSGSLSSRTGMTPPGTPKTPTEVEAEKEAERIQMQDKQVASERVRVQKKTFTKWMNSHLKQNNMKVENLFEDIKDGEYLLSLLEVLSGEKLEMKKGKLKNVHISNISTALLFLEQKKMELVNVNVSDIANGEPTIVFRLMWTIILYFQIEDTFAQTATDESGEQKFRMNAKKAVLTWTANAITKKYGIEITNFGKCWRDGLAFNALIDTIDPDFVDFDQCRKQNARTNLEQAFYVAESLLGIPRLLDVEDVDVEEPDEKSVMIYVAQFLKAYPKAGENHSIMATNRMWTCQYCTFVNDTSSGICDACGHMHVQDKFDTILDKYDLPTRTQDTSTVEFDRESQIRIVFIGRTGNGKSATLNTILRKNLFESRASATSVTCECKRGETIQAGKKVIVVDTPGLFDTRMENEDVMTKIVKYTSITSPGPHALVLVVRIGRFTDEEHDTFQHFVNYFGKGILRYLIVLFTRKDDISKENQSIHQYVDNVPDTLKAVLHQCGNRYIAFNNDAVGQPQREQVGQFFDMVDLMLTRNGRSCYTNELYVEAENTLQRRMGHRTEILEKQKQQETDEIIHRLEKTYEQKLEKEILEKSRLEEAFKSMKIREESSEQVRVKLMHDMNTLQNQLLYRSNMEDRRGMEQRIESLQQHLHANNKANIEKENERLQRDLDESNRRYERISETRDNELREQVRRIEIEYESRLNSENRRAREIENIGNCPLDNIIKGFKHIGKGVVKIIKIFTSL